MLRMSVPEEEARVRRKLEAVLLKAAGLPHHQIAAIVGVS